MRYEENVDDLADIAQENLPGDLAMLGDQLSDDAKHLAERYPAERARVNLVLPHRHFWGRVAAAVILVSLGAAGAVLAMRPWKPVEVAKAVVEKPPANTTSAVAQHSSEETSSADRPGFEVREMAFDPNPPAGTASNLSEVQMLRIQLTAFEQVIHKLQDELTRRESLQAERDKVIDQLREEVNQLRRQIDASQKTDAAK